MEEGGHRTPNARLPDSIAKHFGHIGGQICYEEYGGDNVGECIQPNHQNHFIA